MKSYQIVVRNEKAIMDKIKLLTCLMAPIIIVFYVDKYDSQWDLGWTFYCITLSLIFAMNLGVGIYMKSFIKYEELFINNTEIYSNSLGVIKFHEIKNYKIKRDQRLPKELYLSFKTIDGKEFGFKRKEKQIETIFTKYKHQDIDDFVEDFEKIMIEKVIPVEKKKNIIKEWFSKYSKNRTKNCK